VLTTTFTHDMLVGDGTGSGPGSGTGGLADGIADSFGSEDTTAGYVLVIPVAGWWTDGG